MFTRTLFSTHSYRWLETLFDNPITSQSTASSRFVPAAVGQMALPMRAEVNPSAIVTYWPKPGWRVLASEQLIGSRRSVAVLRQARPTAQNPRGEFCAVRSRSRPRDELWPAKTQKPLTYAHGRRRSGLQNKPLSRLARRKTPGFCQPHCDFNISSKSQHAARQQVTASTQKTADAKPSKPRGLEYFVREHTKPARQNSPPL